MALFDQQLWCWGQVIRRPEGNLLLAYGMTRQRLPETIKGSSLYRYRLLGLSILQPADFMSMSSTEDTVLAPWQSCALSHLPHAVRRGGV